MTNKQYIRLLKPEHAAAQAAEYAYRLRQLDDRNMFAEDTLQAINTAIGMRRECGFVTRANSVHEVEGLASAALGEFGNMFSVERVRQCLGRYTSGMLQADMATVEAFITQSGIPQ